jgi:PIN domain nuclease of toxin-antitoxin system
MKLLLDTHALIWFAENDPRLSARARQALSDAANDSWCSVASIWEMAIKVSVGKLKLGRQLDTNFRRCLDANGITILPVEFEHAAHVLGLPWYHRDPFDRLLVAQAVLEQLTLVSHDDQLDAYGIRRIW